MVSQSWDSVSVSGHTTGGQERRKEAAVRLVAAKRLVRRVQVKSAAVADR